MQHPYFVALDLDDRDRLHALVDKVSDFAGGFKIGPRLCLRYGGSLVSELAKKRPVFVDNKYFDIPSTMEAAVKATFETGASYTTVHAQAGAQALKQLAKLERSLNETRPFKILAVTVLTSFQQSGLPSVSNAMPIAEQVEALADLAIDCGLSGIVCSAEEVSRLKKRHPEAYLVVPGIRLPGDDAGDQQRIVTPEEAFARGAGALVIGRPIVQATDPATVAKKIAAICQKART